MADLEVFFPIEEAMTRALAQVLLPAVSEQLEQAGDDPRSAERAIDQINLGPAAASVRENLALLGTNAVLLGAAQFTEGREVLLTRFMQEMSIPPEVDMAVEQLIVSLDGSGTEQVRQEAQKVLQAAEAEDEATPVTGMSTTTLFPTRRVKKQFEGLAGQLNSAVASGVRLQSSVGANLATSRLVQFGGLSQANAGGITTYQWNSQLDSKTCPFCVGMNGKTFSVGPSLSAVTQILRSTDPNVAKTLSPWPRQTIANLNSLAGMSGSKLQDQGFSLPPAHPRCRCVPSIVGTVPRSEIVGFLRIKPGKGSVQQQLQAHRANRARPRPRRVAPEAIETEVGSDALLSFAEAESTEGMWLSEGEWLESRVRGVHNPAMSSLFEGKSVVPVGQQPRAHFLGGGSGAGKGTIQRKGLVRTTNRTITVDPDELKKVLPEYNRMIAAGDPRAAAFAHEESSFLSKRAMREGLGNRNEMLLDGTGDGGIVKLTSKVQQARDAGYKVTADYVTIPTDEAVTRALARGQRTGRLVPESRIREIHRQVSRDFRDAIDRNLFDEVRLYDNFVADEPILVLQQREGRTTLFRRDLWDDFLAKADEDVTRRTIGQAQID
ncbi:MAG: zeta toxin family protein, partial [Acidobacteriota bacterium]